jgi:ribosomal protein L20
MKKEQILLNRKVLSQLVVLDPTSFKHLQIVRKKLRS